ncbi:hypothetical protein MSG28_012555 [Choristoneura fumiferana]|uniref:Uncharacterized protein n=1 Tax=Choristoneura fumiferana TaxID=7141 RepID=A0ACC0JH41_CHOFU|nr:hypothetical protein MSG28_012555 [Choristoneura fumiferana]
MLYRAINGESSSAGVERREDPGPAPHASAQTAQRYEDLHWAVHGKLNRRHPQRMVSQPDLQPQWSKRLNCDQIDVTADNSGVLLFCLSPSPRRWTWYGHALYKHTLRAAYQAGQIWRNALKPEVSVPCPSSWGWTKAKESWQKKVSLLDH